MAKKISISMSPLMKEVGSNVLNPSALFNDKEYDKILTDISTHSPIISPDFSDIDEGVDHLTSKTREELVNFETGINNETPTNFETGINNETPTNFETGINNETPTNFETGINNETPTNFETGINNETPANFETGINNETPANFETGIKMKGPNSIKIDLNLMERERVSIDCIRLEAIVKSLFKSKKLKKDDWIQISRDTLKTYKINGARLNETRLACKDNGAVDFKIENEGIKGKERILYRPMK